MFQQRSNAAVPYRGRQRVIGVVAVAVALLAAAPVFAQRASLADRVARLEQQNAMQTQGSGQANLELQNRVTELQSEVSLLRSAIEQLQNENEQLKQRAREQYIDIDSRLSRLEGSASPTTGDVTEPAAAVDAPAAQDVSESESAAGEPNEVAAPAKPVAAEFSQRAPVTAPKQPSNPAEAEAAYAHALDTLVKNYEAAESARLFLGFLETYGDSPLVPNALYWLGESYYVTQNYDLAAESFQSAVSQYPGSRKEPDALLKLAYCRIALGQIAEAETGLRDLITRHPGTDAAGKAQSRLQILLRDGR